MIDAKELRITNIVEYNGEHKTMGELFNVSNNRHWNPIPLTKEWPFKFGFRYDKRRDYWELNGFIINWDSENKIWFLMCANWCVEMKYVHQLQNAFYLTGEELTIKE